MCWLDKMIKNYVSYIKTSLTLFRFLRNKIYLYFLDTLTPMGVAAAKGEYVSHDR